MPDPNIALMAKIRQQWGALIAAACANSSVPQAFIAALIANESGGDAGISRFEPAIFTQVAELFLGLRASLAVTGVEHPIGPDDLCPNWRIRMFPSVLADVKALATSWGLTQIMGWHFYALGVETVCPTVPRQLDSTLRLMAAAAPHFEMDLAMPSPSEVREWFTWWNSGSPTGKTFDPNYAANGLARMLIYEAAPEEDAPAVPEGQPIQ